MKVPLEILLIEAKGFVRESNVALARLHRNALEVGLGEQRGDFEDYDEARLNVWEDAYDRLEAIANAHARERHAEVEEQDQQVGGPPPDEIVDYSLASLGSCGCTDYHMADCPTLER